MDWTALIQILIGGTFMSFISSFLTLKATRKKADADAKSSELDNIQEAIKIWREALVESRRDNEDIQKQLDALRKEIAKLTSITNRVLKLLDKITPENLETTIEQIRDEIHNRTA